MLDGSAILLTINCPICGMLLNWVNTVTDCVHASVVNCYVKVSSIFHIYMDYCIKVCHRIRRASFADNHRYHFILQSPLPPQSVYLTVIDNKVQLTDNVIT